MAKSKSGGTRSYLRGRIANDVYSIGKDSKGAKQQVVRSLAEQVANPQTAAQMRGRMIMSTIMQAVSAMSQIIDHSFDSVPTGQPSLSEFIRVNYALLKADVAAHPASGNKFALNGYQEKGIQPGQYQVSEGKAVEPGTIHKDTTNGYFDVLFASGELTAGAVWDKMGLSDGGYITLLVINDMQQFGFVRIHKAASVEQSTVVTSENIDSIFEVDDESGSEVIFTLQAQSGTQSIIITVNPPSNTGVIVALACIKSTPDGAKWIHSSSTFTVAATIGSPADEALPTYPEGSQRFLNGGEL